MTSGPSSSPAQTPAERRFSHVERRPCTPNAPPSTFIAVAGVVQPGPLPVSAELLLRCDSASGGRAGHRRSPRRVGVSKQTIERFATGALRLSRSASRPRSERRSARCTDRARERPGDSLDHLEAADDHAPELVDRAASAADDHVVGSGDVVGGHDPGDVAHVVQPRTRPCPPRSGSARTR